MKVASGAWSRVACSRFSVPLALTVKSVCGSRAAQSCEGCAAVWTTSSMPGRACEHAPTASASRMSRCSERKAPSSVARPGARWSARRRGRARRTGSACRSRGRRRRSPARRSSATDSEPISPPEPVMIAMPISQASEGARDERSCSPIHARCRTVSGAGPPRAASRSAAQRAAVRDVDRTSPARVCGSEPICDVVARELAAQLRRLAQRQAALARRRRR